MNITVTPTSAISARAASLKAPVRCAHCNRLLFRWLPKGTANIEVKCPRCSRLSNLSLST